MNTPIISHTMTVEEFKRKYEIEADVPTDLTALFGKFNVSVLPKVFDEDHESYILCEFVTDESCRTTIYYREAFLCMKGYPDRAVPVYALIHHLISGEKNFCITPETEFSRREKLFVYELLMPEKQLNDLAKKMGSAAEDKDEEGDVDPPPVVYSLLVNLLSKIFKVPHEFVQERLDALETEN